MSCCEAKTTGPNTPTGDVSIVNVGGGFEIYRNGTGPNPFELRTLFSNTIEVIQAAQSLTFEFELENLSDTGCSIWDGLYNPAGFKSIFSAPADGISVSCEDDRIRLVNIDKGSDVTLTSAGGGASIVADGTGPALANKSLVQGANVTITSDANTVTIAAASGAVEGYYSEKTDIVTTNGTAYVTVSTMDAVANGNSGETWVFVASCEVCHPAGLSTVNTRIEWQIETSTNNFTTIETDINICEPITIGVGQRSSPRTRTYQQVLAMNSPRFRLRMSMSAVVATGAQVEFAQVSGFRRTV